MTEVTSHHKEMGNSMSLKGRVRVKAVKTITVNLPEGSCECSQFQKSLIPCKHMFAIFSHFPSDWSSGRLRHGNLIFT